MSGFTYSHVSQDRQIVTGAFNRRAPLIEKLARRLAKLRFCAIAVAIVEHRWARLRWGDRTLGSDAAALLKLIAWGPVAFVAWDDLTPIDRPTFTDR